jgi:hypothetical protein
MYKKSANIAISSTPLRQITLDTLHLKYMQLKLPKAILNFVIPIRNSPKQTKPDGIMCSAVIPKPASITNTNWHSE